MKKQTAYTIIAFLIGIIIAQYFFNKGHVINEVTKIDAEESHEASQPVKKAKPVTSQALMKPKAIKPEQDSAPIQPEKVIENEAQLKEDKTTPPRRFELTLDEQTVGNLERNINDLSVKVRLQREDLGWRVGYLTPDNLMAATGIHDNDLVLYELIETAKSNPRNKSLVVRLENIFSTLER